MIRKNYNLTEDLRKQEKRKQGAIQKRQKHQLQLERAQNTDPIRLYRRIQRLKDDKNSDKKLVARLEDDWDFIRKNGIHKDQLEPFLARINEKNERLEQQKSKLWGMKSVYFNPELNPLGKVPRISQHKELPNATVPLKAKSSHPKDPRILSMAIPLPPGEPPKYYKLVQNIGDGHRSAIESSSTTSEMFVPIQTLKRRRKSNEFAPEEEEYKRQKDKRIEQTLPLP